MAKFRKKPVVIEAFQYRAGAPSDAIFADWPQWAKDDLAHDVGGMIVSRDGSPKRRLVAYDDRLIVRTLEGDMMATDGDWIIQGVKGELYPCKPDIFAATYEAVA
jgi:hypothetical protein